MGPKEMAVYAGGAMAYALVLAAAFWGLAALLGRRPGRDVLMLALAILFVVFLGLHPFPDPSRLDCASGGPEPILRPFAFLDGYRRFWREQRAVSDWIHSLRIVSPVMNVALFMPVGMALGRLSRRLWVAVAVGLGVSLFIEISQLTALYGIYPCRYRHFEADDLILNTLGTVLGLLAMRWWRRGE